MKETPPRPSLLRRLANLDAEKVRRRVAYLLAASRCWAERLCGYTYPRWVDVITTSMTRNEKQALFRFARQLPHGSVVAEIGSYYGASSCCLGSGIRSGGKVWCIDTWLNDAVSDARADVFPIYQRHTAPYTEVIQAVRGYSHEVVGQIPDGLSLLFVDGDHSYEGVQRDLLLYLPKLREDGILVMHDWNHDSVRRAVVELVQPHQITRLVVLPNLYSCRVTYLP